MYIREFTELAQIEKELRKIGVHGAGIEIMKKKIPCLGIKIKDVSFPEAMILKQEMLSIGGDTGLQKDSILGKLQNMDLILLGTYSHFEKLSEKLEKQPFSLNQKSKEVKELIKNYSKQEKKVPKIMGILNITEDSFSDGGDFFGQEKAIEHAKKMIDDGADIIDIGAKSSAPDAKEVLEEEEIKRMIPIIKEISNLITVSVDTQSAKVAEESLKNGAKIINDISALRKDEKLAQVIAKYNAKVVLMYSKDGARETNRDKKEYEDVVGEIYEFLEERVKFAEKKGINKENIIIDPGMGFFISAIPEYSYEIIDNLKSFLGLGCEILIGTSRKSFLGGEIDQRDTKTLIADTVAIQNFANIIRTHETSFTRDIKEFFENLN